MSTNHGGHITQPNGGRNARRKLASFVIALWLESGDGAGSAEWRWRVVDVATGERRYFRRLTDLLAYVSQRSGASPPR